MVVSDTTKNVKKARALIAKKWPWILNAGDPCHQLNLMAKDIIVGSKTYPKIKPFAAIIAQVSSITTFFSRSNYSQFWLKKELEKEKDKRGIEAAGATRFSSFSTNAKSVQRCFPALQRAYEGGHLKFDTAVCLILSTHWFISLTLSDRLARMLNVLSRRDRPHGTFCRVSRLLTHY